jgi:hypothetical protein
MNSLKKYLGMIWVLLGPALIAFMGWQAYQKIEAATPGHLRTNMIVQWSIIMLVFIPICAGLVIFGYYAWKNEYRKLPAASDDL